MSEPTFSAEYVLPDDEVIITHTDPSSRITYANQAFLRASELTLEECIGQPQNVVRHPSMPKEAFADLWETIRSGRSWTGIVKNKRKSGGFYWVRAHVTPIVENGRIAGYMSVRVRPSRGEITAAESLYAAIREGRAGTLRIVSGHIVDASMLGTLKRLLKPSLKVGTYWVQGFSSSLFASLAISQWVSAGFSWSVLTCMLGAFVAFANMVYVQLYVVAPMAVLRKAAMQLVVGDTRTRVDSGGVTCVAEVAHALEHVRVKLDGVLKDNRFAAANVGDGVQAVVAANTALSSRTQQQAASLEETAASMEELTATVLRNTDNAKYAAKMASESSVTTVRGREIVSEVFATMSEIATSSKRIGEIVGMIDGIAFQTNLLALNAAVEAARAGEQGRGFAVVAQEVRSLAQRSAASAKEIRELIQTSGQTVERGSKLASQAESSMQGVVDVVKQVAEVIHQIELASGEQSSGIEQINKTVAQMDAMIQRDAQVSQELIGTAEALQEQSRQMLAAISAFSIQKQAPSNELPHRVGSVTPPEGSLRRVA